MSLNSELFGCDCRSPQANNQTGCLVGPRRVDDEKILLPPPSRETASGEFKLGTITYGEKELYPIFLRRENFQKHIGIYAITGGGKTNVAQIILLGLLRENIPFLVVDWKRSYRDLYSLKNKAAKEI